MNKTSFILRSQRGGPKKPKAEQLRDSSRQRQEILLQYDCRCRCRCCCCVCVVLCGLTKVDCQKGKSTRLEMLPEPKLELELDDDMMM